MTKSTGSGDGSTGPVEIMSEALSKLAARVEALSGPDRSVDKDIDAAMQGLGLSLVVLDLAGAPAYTASVDAAMRLLPEDHAFVIDWGRYAEKTGLFWEAYVQRQDDAVARGNAEADTPALALCAAALRARAAA